VCALRNCGQVWHNAAYKSARAGFGIMLHAVVRLMAESCWLCWHNLSQDGPYCRLPVVDRQHAATTTLGLAGHMIQAYLQLTSSSNGRLVRLLRRFGGVACTEWSRSGANGGFVQHAGLCRLPQHLEKAAL
jgi:hypothetical protein